MNDLGGKAYYHLPGLFEFYELYRVFLPLFREHRAYFYDWCEIGSIYGAPADCIWGGGRAGFGEQSAEEVLALTAGVRHLCPAHLQQFTAAEGTPRATRNAMPCVRCLKRDSGVQNGVIVHSELLLEYLKARYPELLLRVLHHQGPDGVSAAAAGSWNGRSSAMWCRTSG